MCGVCDLALSRPFACLHCDFAGCWLEGHALGHLRDAGHNFCADTKTGSIFCAQCQDFIYHPKVDEIYLAAVVMTEEQQTKFQGLFTQLTNYQNIIVIFPSIKKTSGTVPNLGSRSKGHPRAKEFGPDSVSSPSRSTKSRANLFPKCRVAVLCAQPPSSELFPER